MHSVDGKKCHWCQRPATKDQQDCDEGFYCIEDENGSCVRFSSGDTTYFSCDRLKDFPSGRVFNS